VKDNTPTSAPLRVQQVQTVLLRAMAGNMLVAISKLVVGLLTGTLSMVADGFHSTMDAASNIIGIAGTRMAARPPDDDHPYGHRRFETMATLAIGGLLLVAAWEILSTAIERLFSGSHTEVTPYSFAVMILSMVMSVIVSAYENFHGKRLRSEVLLADAAQTRVDFVVSISVIVGLIITQAGFRLADPLIALFIVALIGRTAFGILRQTTAILVDAAPINPATIRDLIETTPGVENITRVRSRGPVDSALVDVEVQVQPAVTTDHANAIAQEIADRVKGAQQGVSEVQVQFTPRHDQPLDRPLQARAIADALGLSIHEVTEILTDQGLTLEMHVEVDPALTLRVAHTQVTELERRICLSIPEIKNVITHIEPASGQPGAVMHTARAISQRDQAVKIANELYPDAHWHDATIRPVLGGYAMTLDCWLPGTVSVQEAHTIAEHVETSIRAALPQVQRVTIHTEPPEDETPNAEPPSAASNGHQ